VICAARVGDELAFTVISSQQSGGLLTRVMAKQLGRSKVRGDIEPRPCRRAHKRHSGDPDQYEPDQARSGPRHRGQDMTTRSSIPGCVKKNPSTPGGTLAAGQIKERRRARSEADIGAGGARTIRRSGTAGSTPGNSMATRACRASSNE